jgi:hypothetical protein
MEFHFEIPVISLNLKAERAEKGTHDDIGLFEDIESSNESNPFSYFKNRKLE